MFRKLIGIDYLGNKYYVKTVFGSSLQKRFVKYATSDFTAIPPEWDVWLRYTVSDVPTAPLVSDVYCGNISGSPYANFPQGHISKKVRKIYLNYQRWVPS